MVIHWLRIIDLLHNWQCWICAEIFRWARKEKPRVPKGTKGQQFALGGKRELDDAQWKISRKDGVVQLCKRSNKKWLPKEPKLNVPS